MNTFNPSSLRYLQKETEISFPTSPDGNIVSPEAVSNVTKNKFTPIFSKTKRSQSISEISENEIFNLGVKEVSVHKMKLPSLELLKPLQKKKHYKNTYSLDNRKYLVNIFLLFHN